MNCQQIDKYLYDYCDGTISPELKQVIEEHLQTCPFCRNNHKLTLIENEALKEGFVPALSTDFTGRVVAAINSRNLEVCPQNVFIRAIKELGLTRIYLVSAVVAVIAILAIFNTGWFDHFNFRIADNDNVLQTHKSNPTSSANVTKSINIKNGEVGTKNLNNVFNDVQAETGSDENTPKISKSPNEIETDISDTNTPLTVNDDSSIANPPKSMSIASIQQTARGGGHEALLILKPINVPSEYEMTGFNQNGQNITYKYSNIVDENKEFAVVISPQTTAVSNQDLMMEQPKADITNLETKKNFDSSSITKSIIHNSKAYNVTISGSLNQSELESLAKSLDFED